MAIGITLTLGAGLGSDLGPTFNLTADVGSVTPSTATKSELTAGKSVSVDDAATTVTVTSTGTCTNTITQTIPCATTTTAAPTTTTTTTTTTTVAPPSYKYSSANAADACTSGTPMTVVALYGSTFCGGTGIRCNEFESEIAGANLWVSDGTDVRQVVIDDPNDTGTATYVGACSSCSGLSTTTTTTTTTTTAGSGNIVINNGSGFGASIDDFTPAWFLIDLGSIPITNGNSASGTHSGYVGDIGISVSGASGFYLKLYVNSSPIQSVGVTSDGIYSFIGASILSSDSVQIDLTTTP